MKFRELRRVLQTIVLAGLPACTGDIDGPDVERTDTGECGHEEKAYFDFYAEDLPLTLKVESCRVDADACHQLCLMLTSRAGLYSPSECKVAFQGERVMVGTHASWSANCPGEGRRPAGLVEPKCFEAPTAIGAWLAHAAWLEAASIPAFVYLARELDQLGAPRGLARAALAAARDEIRHAQIMTRLAVKHGAIPPTVEVAPPTIRTLEDIAIENAAEGCVRETWGAISALWQAKRAQDDQLRAVFREIAEDESRHAALAWAVDTWASTRLDRAAMKRVADARANAVRELFAYEVPHTIAMLGLPSTTEARTLLDRAASQLWPAAVAPVRRSGVIAIGGVS